MIRVPFHAVVFPLFPVLFAAAVNNGEVSGRGWNMRHRWKMAVAAMIIPIATCSISCPEPFCR